MVRNRSLAKSERLWHKPMIFKYEFAGIEFLTDHIHKEQSNSVKAERTRSFGCPNQFHLPMPKHRSSIDIIIVMLLRAKPQQSSALSNFSNFSVVSKWALPILKSSSLVLECSGSAPPCGSPAMVTRISLFLTDVLSIRISRTLQMAVMDHPRTLTKSSEWLMGRN